MTDPSHPAPAEDDLLSFAPVPSRTARHDGWTPDRQRRFVAALGAMGSVGHAASAVGMSAASAYKLRRRAGAEGFAAAWDAALSEGRDRAFDRALDRAMNGVTTPRYYRGKVVGTRHRFDNRLLMAALMPPAPPARRPGGKN